MKTVSHASPPYQANHTAAILRSPITSILMIPFSQLLSWVSISEHPCLHSSYTFSLHWCNILREGDILKLLKFYPHIWLRLCVDVVFEVRKQYHLVFSVAFTWDIFILGSLCMNFLLLLILFGFVYKIIQKLVVSFFNLKYSEFSHICAFLWVDFYPFCWELNSESPFCWKLMSFTALVAQMVTNLPPRQETWVGSLSWEDLLEKGMAIHSTILAWRIPWTEEPGRL